MAPFYRGVVLFGPPEQQAGMFSFSYTKKHTSVYEAKRRKSLHQISLFPNLKIIFAGGLLQIGHPPAEIFPSL